MYQHGELIETIGPVGDDTSERNYILAKHGLNFKLYSNSFTKKRNKSHGTRMAKTQHEVFVQSSVNTLYSVYNE